MDLGTAMACIHAQKEEIESLKKQLWDLTASTSKEIIHLREQLELADQMTTDNAKRIVKYFNMSKKQ